nr:RNA-directed DNA polymerase, eukaryota, reverse transcriptase zinc-binding domain protein [Tanacetum cinerariifolium]
MNMGMESNPVLVLDESCVNHQVYAYYLWGKVKEFASLTNLKVVLVSGGFDNVKLRYMGGFWVLLEFSSEEVKMKFPSSVELKGIPLKMWSENMFKRIASKWVVRLHVDDQEESCFHRKRVCINTIGYFNTLESFKIIYQGKAYWVHAKEVPGSVSDFVEENDEVDESDDESLEVESNGDNLNNGSKDTDSLKYPLGFTPRDDIEDGEVQSIERNVPVDGRDEGTHNIHEEVEASGVKKSDSKKNSKGVQPQQARLNITMDFPRNLSSIQQADLEIEVTNEEIKRAIWDCGVDKSPGPDGFTFGFYYHFWKLIENDVVDAVKYFFHHGFLPKGSNSSFIALILKTPGANMVKDFRSIGLLAAFIKSLPRFWQIDLWLFWVILLMRVVDAGMFKGVVIGHSMQLSHMFYADDVVFVGQWNDSNIYIIVRVLDCFYHASGLCINMSISVDEEKVNQAASKIGCVALKALFSYLGSKVGGIMGRLTLLKSVLGSMLIYHMSIFKVPMKVLQRMESIRCHFFNGAYLGGKKSMWVKWKNILVSKEKGGLGVSSLYALNRALMFKWVWWFITQRTSLWTRVIKAIHEDDGKIGKSSKAAFSSIWLDIVHEMEIFKKQGINVCSFIHKKLGNGKDTIFWGSLA